MQIVKKISEYKLNILGILFEGLPVTSGEVHKRLDKEMNGSQPSRASVILFLNLLVDFNMATYTKDTGKGGWHRIYSLKGTPEDFLKQLQLETLEQYNEIWLHPLKART